jgi:ADP-heptose:LPS heptosyltransferase
MNAVGGQHGHSRGDGNALQFCVVETFGLGDLVYLTAFLYGLRDALPDARFRVMTGPVGGAFAFPEDLAVEVVAAGWPWANVDWWLHPLRSMRAILHARRHLAPMSGPWVGLDPRGDIRHKYLLRLLKVRDVVRDGTKWQGLGRLLGQTDRHVLESRQAYLETTCRELGIDKHVTLRWPWADGTGASREDSRRVILAPEAGAPLREWPKERWILLSRELRGRGWKTELVIHDLQWGSVDISSEFDGIITGSVRDLSSRLRGAAVVIAVDSFVGHYAAAHGIPVLSLFGPTLAALWKPWGRGHAVVQRDGYACRPCLQIRCVQPESSCMKAIALGEVVDLLRVMTETKTGLP